MPRTSQSAGFDISAFIVSTYHTHNVEKFAAWTAPGNCPHSTEHTTSAKMKQLRGLYAQTFFTF